MFAPVNWGIYGYDFCKVKFERYALDLLRHMTIRDVIKEIQKADLTKRFSKPSLKSLQLLAIY